MMKLAFKRSLVGAVVAGGVVLAGVGAALPSFASTPTTDHHISVTDTTGHPVQKGQPATSKPAGGGPAAGADGSASAGAGNGVSVADSGGSLAHDVQPATSNPAGSSKAGS